MSENLLIATDTNFEELIGSDTPTLVDFYAEWCGPCKMLAPTIEALADEMKGKVRVAKLDVDKAQTTAEIYRIQAVPTLYLFKKGEIKEKVMGPQSKEKLKALIEKYC